MTNSPAPSILVAEDEMLIRLLLSEILADLGCITHEVATAAEALQFVTRNAAISAAILDLGLPDQLGSELASDLRAWRPHLPIMMVSGRQPEEIVKLLRVRDRIEIVQKPFTEADIKGALQRLSVVI